MLICPPRADTKDTHFLAKLCFLLVSLSEREENSSRKRDLQEQEKATRPHVSNSKLTVESK
jgi:hypothetical protein